MNKTVLLIFATSIAFVCSAIAITALMWAIQASGHELIAGHQVDNWLRQGSFTVIYALFSGFLVDSIRWVSSVVWVPAPDRVVGRKNEKRRASQVCVSD